MLTRLTLLLVLLATPAFAETHEVKMLNRNQTGAMPFEPDYLVVRPGDTVRFIAASPGHNAATIDGMIPEGATAFVGKINEEITVTLPQEGVWGIKCSPHYTMGMVMLIQVGDTSVAEADLPDDLPPAARQRLLEILERQKTER
ncbi:MAG: pseudoazurin [Stappia sp.]|uniref:pseudoazurin n=1 Tax=Stappia sp. TaxID=1870903 RepID=UPI000C3920E7|nr:pseudoazurin [Stappia sp.]MAB00856.1 pseudoazurin [Stappia sp.]MBM21465.1 pseudoazurin [Stappia sp.]|tara:strand:+ start:80 stop:511 length:432 start_codon:yes stop_codon:yes gene_type:complete